MVRSIPLMLLIRQEYAFIQKKIPEDKKSLKHSNNGHIHMNKII